VEYLQISQLSSTRLIKLEFSHSNALNKEKKTRAMDLETLGLSSVEW